MMQSLVLTVLRGCEGLSASPVGSGLHVVPRALVRAISHWSAWADPLASPLTTPFPNTALRDATSLQRSTAALPASSTPCATATASHQQGGASRPLDRVGQYCQLYFSRGMGHRVPYSRLVGRPAPHSWPEFEALKAPKGGGELKWHRQVVRFPPEVQVLMKPAAVTAPTGSQDAGHPVLHLTGKAGSVEVDLAPLDPMGLVAFRLLGLAGQPPAVAAAVAGQEAATPGAARGAVLLLASHKRELVQSVAAQVESHARGVSQGFLVGLTVKGVGYRMEPMDTEPIKRTWYNEAAPAGERAGGAAKQPPAPIQYPVARPVQAIRLKVGYSRPIVFPLPSHIRAFLVKPTLMYLYGLRLDELQEMANRIRSVRKPNPYTGNGIQLVGEVIKLKQRKSAK